MTGPSDTLFAEVYVRTFKADNFTGWGSAGVNLAPSRYVLAGNVKGPALFRCSGKVGYSCTSCGRSLPTVLKLCGSWEVGEGVGGGPFPCILHARIMGDESFLA